jgi:hypothetical protein
MIDNQHAAGTAVGVSLGIIKAIINAPILFLTFDIMIDTSILALVGGIAGWTGAEVMKFMKAKWMAFIGKRSRYTEDDD